MVIRGEDAVTGSVAVEQVSEVGSVLDREDFVEGMDQSVSSRESNESK